MRKRISGGSRERPQKIYPDPNRGTAKPYKDRCGYLLSNGRYCANRPMKNVSGCRLHGGKMQQKNRTYGLYARHQPQHIRDKVEQAIQDPRLMDMRQQAALVSVLLTEVWDSVQARMADDLSRAITDYEKELSLRMQDGEIVKVATLSERMASMIERTARIGLAMKMMVSLDTLNQVMQAFVEVASTYVTDARLRKKFVAELQSRVDNLVDDDDTSFNELLKRRPQLDVPDGGNAHGA